ncbi:uncharacterized protein [Maniola hyperantus]|uniref:uncharacterized protein n=1 Tax=Aphantopus hyperantus TaxID=2795564 RepID=UPI001568AB99|nr:uncharacterized protein LOC117997388 isoform X1 [Maniola hyperantus]
MSSKKNDDYRQLPFNSDLISQAEFYTYNNISTLLAMCEEYKEKVLNCRTIGILESLNGRFHLKDIDCKDDTQKIRVSMVHVKSQLPSTVIPYLVQVFGVLQWTSKPVIFAKIVQVLDTATGIRLNEALKSITSLHLANPLNSTEE